MRPGGIEVEILEADDLTLDVTLECGERRVPQRMLERTQQRNRGNGERCDGGDDHRADDAPAQTEGTTPRPRFESGH